MRMNAMLMSKDNVFSNDMHLNVKSGFVFDPPLKTTVDASNSGGKKNVYVRLLRDFKR